MESGMKIAVTGATGRVGRHLVDILGEAGNEVIPISRSVGVDVVTGHGMAEALAGVECVIDTATGSSPDQQAAAEFFTSSARNLYEVGGRTGIERIVVVSIIGCERFSAGYAAAKAEQERLLLAGPIPVQILRAAQFHEFVQQLVDWGTQGEVSYVPTMRTQLVAARTVAEALAELATEGGSAGASALIPEIAGPREESLVDMAKLLLAKRGDPRHVEAVAGSDDPDRELYEEGGLLPSPHATLAGPTFEEWAESNQREVVA
jgi:uncharacterized protein YbjT (DUF2867 family)